MDLVFQKRLRNKILTEEWRITIWAGRLWKQRLSGCGVNYSPRRYMQAQKNSKEEKNIQVNSVPVRVDEVDLAWFRASFFTYGIACPSYWFLDFNDSLYFLYFFGSNIEGMQEIWGETRVIGERWRSCQWDDRSKREKTYMPKKMPLGNLYATMLNFKLGKCGN